MRPVYFAAARRTPIGRLRGALSSVRPDDLAATAVRAVLDAVPALDPARIDDVYWGAANQSGEDNRNVARMAVLLAGLPDTVPGATLNRLCASVLEAVTTAARAIASGEADVVLAGGSESMSRAPFVLPRPDQAL
ncbi:beta-ketoacyl synthase N-terminal-like domain-containing protein, partial [Streptomyces hydrogenans]|uniref:thiolase family protein n=1 Tax=Streptomyces hydrogenans TaxID=1873719 RepID=UPI003639467C